MITVCLFSNILFPKCQDFEKSEQELNEDTFLLTQKVGLPSKIHFNPHPKRKPLKFAFLEKL